MAPDPLNRLFADLDKTALADLRKFVCSSQQEAAAFLAQHQQPDRDTDRTVTPRC